MSKPYMSWLDWFTCGLEWGMTPENKQGPANLLLFGDEPDSWFTGHRIGRSIREAYNRLSR